ncbi:SWF or SNF family helicase [Streptomyces albireticuli]|uniref:SWF or SNF family helicase n=1 Tax=Streptomyces albireticuli TaxID=1940 RepID=UPI001E2A8869|nr:SWF or SNF family helicase [Streptomyces albireticuli]MCD9141219.1 SWF or SNF family helicase [Streptomyces albireticuli]MCD9160820.1 SWF or SNF family helicase [Streptomyces albireticuli]MCD9191123.1 SWF or SNF family helicase [Streptomyces albireticuli]
MTGHDSLERTFAAPPPAPGRAFAESWWGRAWLKALEDTALDGRQVKEGRRHARAGAVGAVSVRPGRITALVRDRDGTAYRSDVLVQQLSGTEWDRLLDLVADRAGHIAALLDHDIPPHLAEDALAAGVELLPGIGDLEPECGCEAWDHCPHTAALCHQVARLLDEDPFVLLLMRGRGERELLDDLQARSASHAPEPAAEASPGVPALDVFTARVAPRALPGPPPPVDAPARPLVLTADTAPPPGLDVEALEFLAAAAAAHARRLLAEALAPGHELTPIPAGPTVSQDAVRLAAAGAPARVAAGLAAGTGRDGAALARAVRAWECGGPAALAVLEEEWTPEPAVLARAGAQLAAAWEEGPAPRLRATRNRWTVVGTSAQLRYGPDGRWWPYRREGGHWLPAGPCAHDPATALAELLTEENG